YLFSNSIPPVVAAASLAVLELLEHTPQLRAQLFENTRLFRAGLARAGFQLRPGEHPIIPVMIGDAALAGRMADRLLERGVYVIGFSYPVVPKGQARIRTQLTAALTREQLERAVDAFTGVGRELGVLSRSNHESTGQAAGGTRYLARGHPRAQGRPQRRADRDRQDRDLRHRHAHLQLGRLGAEN